MEFAKLLLRVYHSAKFQKEKELLFNGYVLDNKDFNFKDYKQFYAVRFKDILLMVMPIRHDGITDWYVIRDGRCSIITQHTLVRFRKRVLNKIEPDTKYNMRGVTKANIKDVFMLSSNLIIDINLMSIIVDGTGINDKYDNNSFMITKYGLIPLEKLDDDIYRSTTFISNEMLTDEQKEIYDSVAKQVQKLEGIDLKGYGVKFQVVKA